MISLDIKIPHLKIAPLVGNLEVGNLEGIRKYKRKRNMGNGHQLELQLHYSKQRKLITTVHGIFLLLLTLDLGGLPSNLLSSPPSTASPSSLSYEHQQPLLPGER